MSLRDLFFKRQEAASLRPATRLSEAQALAIASQALAGETALSVIEVVATASGVRWRIGMVNMGPTAQATIDDATGRVIEVRTWGANER
jgi:hypothetical protein